MKASFQNGIKRIKAKDLKLYEKKQSKWILLDDMPKHTKNAVLHYSENKNLVILIDEITKDFLKGFINFQKLPAGNRVKTLPNGKALARGGF